MRRLSKADSGDIFMALPDPVAPSALSAVAACKKKFGSTGRTQALLLLLLLRQTDRQF